jgi:hypothetical protein
MLRSGPVKWVRSKLSERQWRLVRLWGPIAAGVLLLLIVVSVWLPALAERRIRQRLAPLDLDFRASIGLSLSGAVLRDVEVLTKSGQRLLQARRVEADVSFWQGELRAVSVEEAALEVELEWLRSWQKQRAVRSTGSASQPAQPTAEARKLPALKLAQSRVKLRDAQGAFLDVSGLDVTLLEGALALRLGRVTVGNPPGEVIEVSAAEITGRMAGMLPRIERLTAQGAVLRWNSEGAGIERGATLARLSDWRGAARGRDASAAPAVSAAQPPADDSSRFSDDAKIDVASVRILDVRPGGEVATLLDQLRLSAEAQGQRQWRLRGKGALHHGASGQGSLEWDLALAPRELKVEGRVRLDEVALSLFAPVLPPLPFHELDRTRVRADLQISGTGLSAAAVKGSLSMRDLAFASAGLAETPVGPISFDAEGEALWTPAKRELSGLKAEVRSGKTKTRLSGSLAWPTSSFRVDLVADMQRAACRDVLMVVPAALLGELASVELTGDIATKLTLHVDSQALDATLVDFDVTDKCRFGSVPELLDLKRFERPFVHTVFEPDGTVFEMETGPGSAAWTPIELISPFMTQAAIAHEDGRFLSHHGFAEPEIARALARNLEARAFRFGASTITMQLVKNLFLHRDKLLSRKVQEAFIVWWLEQHWDKRRILEMYLNVIEYGPAIYGIRNAALHYFGQIPLDLTPAQAAFFATILPSPKVFHEQYEKGALSASMKNRVASFLQHLFSRQRIDEEALKFGLEELEHFKFYDPEQPPPAPPQMRGTAQPLPFIKPGLGFDPWSTVTGQEESGSFGP